MTNVSLNRWSTAQTHERELWEAYATTYERYPQILLEQLGQLRAIGEFASEELQSGDIAEALEVGVGPLGIGVLGIQEPDFRITAIDPLKRMELSIPDPALNEYLHALRKKVTYRCLQGETLPFDDECYDFVCCHNTIDHARNPISILNSVFRVLKKGCCFLLTLHTFSHLGRIKFETLRKCNPEKPLFAFHPHSFRHSDISSALSKIGYMIVRQDGGQNSIFGRSRLSTFICRKPD